MAIPFWNPVAEPAYAAPLRFSAEDEAAYAQDMRRTNARTAQYMFALVSVALILWWPFDVIVFAHEPFTRQVLNVYRPVLALSSVTFIALLRFVPACQRFPRVTAVAGASWLIFVFASGLRLLSPPGGAWPQLLNMVMLLTAPYSGGLRQRLLCSSLFGLIAISTYFGLEPAYLRDPTAPYFVSLIIFSCLLGVVGGMLGEHLRRMAFGFRRALQHQAETLEAKVREQTAELRELTKYNESARETERAHIARELHDELGQQLTGLRYALSLAETRFEREPASIGPNLRELAEHLSRTTDTTRDIVMDLRPRILDDLGLGAAAEWLIERTAAKAGLACVFDASEGLEDLPPEVATAAFRILQESLTNVVRHAEAKEVRVTLVRTSTALGMQIADDGVGLQRAGASRLVRRGMGLLGMQERARALGGSVTIRARSPAGTLIDVQLPVEADAPELSA